MTRALVLAGGGLAGIAWELGVLRGLADVRPELGAALPAADLIVGTSAGSAVAAQITSGTDLDTLYQAQLAETSSEIEVDVDLVSLLTLMGEATADAGSPTEVLRRVGQIALATDTVDEARRRLAIASRLPVPSWPAGRLLLPAVDTFSGERVVFDRTSGVELTDAVAASCAVPGVWPPTTIDGRRYMDGGAYSITNADLAAGSDRVLVLVPALPGPPMLGADLSDELAGLAPAETMVIYADDESLAAFGTNPLSPATRAPSARIGRTIGAARAEAVAEFWSA